jgi:hypothetical protein
MNAHRHRGYLKSVWGVHDVAGWAIGLRRGQGYLKWCLRRNRKRYHARDLRLSPSRCCFWVRLSLGNAVQRHVYDAKLASRQGLSRRGVHAWRAMAEVAIAAADVTVQVPPGVPLGTRPRRCVFSCVVDALPEQCPRRRPGVNPLVLAVFRTNRLLCERCSATCQRRRCPGQARHRQGRL